MRSITNWEGISRVLAEQHGRAPRHPTLFPKKARRGWFPPHSFTLRALGRDIAQILDFARSDFHVLGDRTSEHGILDEFKRLRLAWN